MISSEGILELLSSQQKEWELVRDNYLALQQVKTRVEYFDNFQINIQFNPARIISSSAKIDTESIQKRKCFLCPQYLPEAQQGILFGEEYQVLVNPFPIFPRHFTIPTLNHGQQSIVSRYKDMVELARKLDQFVIFYNGPRCGASAPDHMHFQAGNKGFLPIEREWNTQIAQIIYEDGVNRLRILEDYLRTVFIIESFNKEHLNNLFQRLYQLLQTEKDTEEPMLNIVTWYEESKWISCIFPREKHRPDCYYKEGEENLLLSPASVDMGGTLIMPLEKDFDKITKRDIKAIFKEVSLSEVKAEYLIKHLKQTL